MSPGEGVPVKKLASIGEAGGRHVLINNVLEEARRVGGFPRSQAAQQLGRTVAQKAAKGIIPETTEPSSGNAA